MPSLRHLRGRGNGGMHDYPNLKAGLWRCVGKQQAKQNDNENKNKSYNCINHNKSYLVILLLIILWLNSGQIPPTNTITILPLLLFLP